jgi:hypothetical protein
LLPFSGAKIKRGKRKVGEGPKREARGQTNSVSFSKTNVRGKRGVKRSCRKVALLYDVKIR